ncbi:peroxidasin homolog [Osmerus mordax]|uniref:peroxidasin homolog n=1 Tax=Osmerus mordax TaxID=8014 RepID=UPI003510C2AF
MTTLDQSPKAEVTLHPDLQQIFTGERLTLRCQIQGGENNIEWRYFFKRDDVDIGSSESELKIESVEESHRGAYTCVGKDTSNEKYSDWSDEVMLTVTALPTATVNILSPPPAPHYPGDTVTLQCDISQHEDWNYYYWFINDQEYRNCNNKTCSFKLDHNNVQYSCLGRRTRSGQLQDSQRSAPSSITVTALPKATLTVTPNPVYHGETVSLKCSVKSGPAWSYRWYKDRPEITVEQSGRHRISGDSLTISKVESSDQGHYWCTGEIQSRSISTVQSGSISITVEGAVLSVGLVVGLVVTGVLLFLLILLLLGWRKFKGAQSSGASISSQSQSTNHVLDGVQIANQNQAPGGNAPLQHGQGVEAGPSDLTYAQIELKKMKKPKRKTGKPAESEEDTIYSKVATGPPSGGTGADDVTYAQVDLKGKKAKKSDMLTTREPDAVYSAVRTG